MKFIGTLIILILSNVLLASNWDTMEIDFMDHSCIGDDVFQLAQNGPSNRQNNENTNQNEIRIEKSSPFYDGPEDFILNDSGRKWSASVTWTLENVQNTNEIRIKTINNGRSTLASFFQDGNNNAPDDLGMQNGMTLINCLKAEIDIFLSRRGVQLANKDVRCFMVSELLWCYLININGTFCQINQKIYKTIREYNTRISNLYFYNSNAQNTERQDIENRIIEAGEELYNVECDIEQRMKNVKKTENLVKKKN